MLAEIGLASLIASILLALLGAGLAFSYARRDDQNTITLLRRFLFWQFGFISLAFLALIFLYVNSDFSVLNVYQNSHTDKPLLYKISGAWGNHEGSMLLWCWVLTFYGFLWAREKTTSFSSSCFALTAGFLQILQIGFVGFLILTSNPFVKLSPAPIQGLGLNPLLQDPGLAFHPPLLYLGYVGLAMVFCQALAFLLPKNQQENPWPLMQRYAMMAWGFLTIGIGLGSWWAYYELGWGGWWFWDPVENASLMPWLVATALTHILLVTQKRKIFGGWALLLAIMGFSLSLMGTFLVRSGILTSVHSFASDPSRGIFILILMAIFTGGALLLFALRFAPEKPRIFWARLSKDMMILLQSILFFVGMLIVALGTLYPLLLNLLTGDTISIGAPFYEQSFVPILAPVLILAAIAPLIAWREDRIKRIGPIIKKGILLATPLFLILIYARKDDHLATILGMIMIVFLLVMTIYKGILLWRAKKKMTLHDLSFLIGHLGFALAVFAMIGNLGWREESQAALSLNNPKNLLGYELVLHDITTGQNKNYEFLRAEIQIKKEGKIITTMQPEKRLYQNPSQITSESAIYSNLWQDLYLAIGEVKNDEAMIAIMFHKNPLMIWLWLGLFMMGCAGLVRAAESR